MKATLEGIRIVLAHAPRQGEDQDSPEGARYIIISDTLAKDMAECLSHTIFYLKLVEDTLGRIRK